MKEVVEKLDVDARDRYRGDRNWRWGELNALEEGLAAEDAIANVRMESLESIKNWRRRGEEECENVSTIATCPASGYVVRGLLVSLSRVDLAGAAKQ